MGVLKKETDQCESHRPVVYITASPVYKLRRSKKQSAGEACASTHSVLAFPPYFPLIPSKFLFISPSLFMAAIILWVLNHLSYWVIFVGMAIESSFIPFPSEAVVPPAAWLAQQGTLDIVLVVVVATLGADLGGLINYALAYWLGRPVIYRLAETKWAKMLLIDREAIEKSERFFRHHGVVSTLVGRLVPGVRQLISIPAGLSRMHLGKFLLYTTLGAGAWNCVLAFLGFYVIPTAFPDLKTTEQVMDRANRYSHEIGYALIGIVGLLLAYAVYKYWRHQKTKQGKTDGNAQCSDENVH